MSLGDFQAFSNRIIMVTLEICGKSGRWNNVLNMESMNMNLKSSSWRAKEPSDLRNVGGMLSGPAASLHFIF